MDNCENSPNNCTKVPFDPGWNDPPNLSFNQQLTPNRPRLNKRVAFPLSGATSSPSSLPPVNFPPMPASQPLPPVHTNPRILPPEESINIDSENALSAVKDILLQLLENSSELGTKADDIRRRLSVMEDMWTNGKLNKRIHAQMSEMAYALKDEQYSKADDIHKALMVDHVSTVGTWMPGIKQLIRHQSARAELLSIDKEL